VVKLKKYPIRITHFVLFLTFAGIASCGPQQTVSTINGKELRITDASGENAKIAKFIAPYREHINKELNTVLAYAPQTLDKSGQWQSAMGNLFSDAVIKKADPVFLARENKHIDICMLNHGGIRAVIPQGNITKKTAFEIMPFENTAVVVELKGAQILELAEYIIAEKKPHPLSGLTFLIDKNNKPVKLMVQGKSLDVNKTYNVVTNDYLYNGGDNMVFFKKGIQVYDLDYKLRNILIDYFIDVDTVPLIADKRIITE
jgi:2',3'-cyclic-nucleotide 2'-phosphodiesterase (5'-nucleotidase family)